MDKVRIGIIGIGNMGSHHAKDIAAGEIPGGELAAVCDCNPERLEWAKETFGDKVKLFDNAEALLGSGAADAIIIATPHYDHPTLAIKALNKNLHVLIEKPAGVYTGQVREMNEAALKTDRVFGIMYNQRTNPLYRKVREMLRQGTLGEIKRINWIITASSELL